MPPVLHGKAAWGGGGGGCGKAEQGRLCSPVKTTLAVSQPEAPSAEPKAKAQELRPCLDCIRHAQTSIRVSFHYRCVLHSARHSPTRSVGHSPGGCSVARSSAACAPAVPRATLVQALDASAGGCRDVDAAFKHCRAWCIAWLSAGSLPGAASAASPTAPGTTPADSVLGLAAVPPVMSSLSRQAWDK